MVEVIQLQQTAVEYGTLPSFSKGFVFGLIGGIVLMYIIRLVHTLLKPKLEELKKEVEEDDK